MAQPAGSTAQASTRASSPLTGAQAVAAVIAGTPDPHVYGMPGGHTVQIYDALYSFGDRVSTFLVRQESVATVMAEARGRLTGRPAFVIGQGAWVLGNASIGIMEAHLGASPMVLLVDATDGGAFSHHGPYQAGHGGYGAYDLRAALAAITKRTFLAEDATQALQLTQLAIKHAVTGEPGPVAVVFHSRALLQRQDASEPPSYLERSYLGPSAPIASDAGIEGIGELLRSAERPVVIAGNGVRLAQAEEELAGFARATATPVATTPAGKGTFPEDDALALGVIGSFGHDTANAVVGDADVVFAVGTKLGASDTINENPKLIDLRRQRLVHLDAEPLNVSWTMPSDAVAVGDAKDGLRRLAVALDGFRSDGRDRVSRARGLVTYFDRAPSSSEGRLSGRDVVTELSRHAPEDAIVTCDAGENRLFVLRDFQSKQGGTVLQPNGGGGMGYAIPAAMAASLAAPGRRAIAVCGDGGYSMTLTALLTAVDLGLTLTVIVLNNRSLGWVSSGQRGREIASRLRDFDYAGIAESIGARAHRVGSPGEAARAIREANTAPGVSVIVATTTTDDRYQDLMSPLTSGDVYAVAGDD